MTVDPHALMNRGRKITLLDGTPATVSFDLEALAQIEADFGSLGGWQDQLNLIAKEQTKAQFVKPLLLMLRAGLLHDPSFDGARFDPQRLDEYFEAVMEAAKEAFPQETQGTPNRATRRKSTANSLGKASTTRQPSVSSVATATSGA